MTDCERLQELIGLAEDELTAEERAFMASHLASCPDCAALMAVWADCTVLLAEEDAEPPEALLTGVMAGVREINAARASEKKKRTRTLILRWTAAAASFAVVLLAGIRLGQNLSRSSFDSTLETTQTQSASSTSDSASTGTSGGQSRNSFFKNEKSAEKAEAYAVTGTPAEAGEESFVLDDAMLSASLYAGAADADENGGIWTDEALFALEEAEEADEAPGLDTGFLGETAPQASTAPAPDALPEPEPPAAGGASNALPAEAPMAPADEPTEAVTTTFPEPESPETITEAELPPDALKTAESAAPGAEEPDAVPPIESPAPEPSAEAEKAEEPESEASQPEAPASEPPEEAEAPASEPPVRGEDLTDPRTGLTYSSSVLILSFAPEAEDDAIDAFLAENGLTVVYRYTLINGAAVSFPAVSSVEELDALCARLEESELILAARKDGVIYLTDPVTPPQAVG